MPQFPGGFEFKIFVLRSEFCVEVINDRKLLQTLAKKIVIVREPSPALPVKAVCNIKLRCSITVLRVGTSKVFAGGDEIVAPKICQAPGKLGLIDLVGSDDHLTARSGILDGRGRLRRYFGQGARFRGVNEDDRSEINR